MGDRLRHRYVIWRFKDGDIGMSNLGIKYGDIGMSNGGITDGDIGI